MDIDASSWRSLLAEAEQRGCARRDAQRIACAVADLAWVELVRELDSAVPELLQRSFRSRVARRVAGEPLQYVIGAWGFRTLELAVDRRALIPRPETEVVADVAIGAAAAVARSGRAPVVVDLGTGTGAIALAVATEVPTAEVWATDISAGAVALASANVAGSGRDVASRVRVALGSWWSALPDAVRGEVDVVVSNPPYVELGAPLPAEVRDWEPSDALFAGPDGLDAFRAICAGVSDWLAAGASFVVEIGETQAEAVSELLRSAGLVDVHVGNDLAGRPRVVHGRRP